MINENLTKIAAQKGYKTRKRHIFLCTRGSCASEQESLKLWEFLKQRLKEIEPDVKKATIARTQSGCLRICTGGPIAIVYPEGTLYGHLNEEKLEKIIQDHLINGIPVKEFEIKVDT